MGLYKSRFSPLFTDRTIINAVDCGDPEYCHQFVDGDTIYAQFYQTPCGNNEMADPTFTDYTEGADLLGGDGTFTGCPPAAEWTLGGNWVCDGVGNKVDCTAGAASMLSYFPAGVLAGNTYRIAFDLTRTAGSLYVSLSAGPTLVESVSYDTTGSYEVDLYIPAGLLTDQVAFTTDTDFVGSLDNITVKLLTYNSWTENTSWGFADGEACKSVTGTDDLVESVASYTTAGGYYSLTFTISDYVSGTLTPYVANVTDQDTTVISENGTYTLYFETVLTGVVKFTPSSDFIGCVSGLDLRLLQNDYLIELVSDTNTYSISASYYHQFVTFNYTFTSEGLPIPYDCYELYIYDTCLTSGAELITGGNFADGGTGWSTVGAFGKTVSFAASKLTIGFDPTTGTDLITNGDFGTGDFTGWTAGAGWAVVGNAAQHTAGNTATLAQTVVAGDTNIYFWIQFTISGRTAGSISVTATGCNTQTFSANGTILTPLFGPATITAGQNITITFTPSSTFDGTLDNIEFYQYITQYGYGNIKSPTNANITLDATYEFSLDVDSVPNADVKGVMTYIEPNNYNSLSATTGTRTEQQAIYFPDVISIPRGSIYFSWESDTIANSYYTGDFVVDNYSIVRVEPFEATFISECIQYRESLANSKLFQGYCDSESFGFEFVNSGFRLQERLVCRSFAPSYEKDKRIYNYGSGDSGVYYSEVTKWQGVYLDAVPETVHDTMALMLDCDHFIIGDTEDTAVEYVARVEDYTPEWDRTGTHSLATARFDVKPKDGGMIFNRDC